jgi:hypothetical protein
MFQLELVSFPNLCLQLRGPRFFGIQSLLNYLVQKVVSKDFHYCSVHWRLWQREHLLETIVRESNPHVAVRDEHALDQACQDGAQTEVFVSNLSRNLSLPLRHFQKVLMNLPEDPRTSKFMGQRSVGNQVAHFAAQKKYAAPDHDRQQGNGAYEDQPNGKPPDSHGVRFVRNL